MDRWVPPPAALPLPGGTLLHLRAQQPEPSPRYVRWLGRRVPRRLRLRRRRSACSSASAPDAPPASPPSRSPSRRDSRTPAPRAARRRRAGAGGSGRRRAAAPSRGDGQRSARGETLAESLQIRGIAADRIHVIAREMAPVLDFRYSKPGDHYRLVLTADGDVESFRYERSARGELRAGPPAATASSRRTHQPGDPAPPRAHRGPRDLQPLRRDRAARREPRAGRGLRRDLRLGRRLQPRRAARRRVLDPLRAALHPRRRRAARPTCGPGQILAARYTSASDDHRAVYFEPVEGHGAYYRPDGEPMERQFLKAPARLQAHQLDATRTRACTRSSGSGARTTASTTRRPTGRRSGRWPTAR